MRRLLVLSVPAVHLAFVRPARAEDLRERMKLLNDRDAELVKNKKVKDISQWKLPIRRILQ